eukprot:7386043-Prymnesium_polylepis.1
MRRGLAVLVPAAACVLPRPAQPAVQLVDESGGGVPLAAEARDLLVQQQRLRGLLSAEAGPFDDLLQGLRARGRAGRGGRRAVLDQLVHQARGCRVLLHPLRDEALQLLAGGRSECGLRRLGRGVRIALVAHRWHAAARE